MVVGCEERTNVLSNTKNAFLSTLDRQKTAGEAVLRGSVIGLWKPDQVVGRDDGVPGKAGALGFFAHGFRFVEAGVMRHPQGFHSSLFRKRPALSRPHMAIATGVFFANAA